MRILCLCVGGNTRSVTAATLLKYHWWEDALAASVEKNSKDTLDMLYKWADRVLLMAPEIEDELPSWVIHHTIDVGRDVWGMSMHPDLIPIIYKGLTEWLGESKTRKNSEEVVIYGVNKYIRKSREAARDDTSTDAGVQFNSESS